MPSLRGGSCLASLAKGVMEAAMVIYRNNGGLRLLRWRKPLLFFGIDPLPIMPLPCISIWL